MIKQSLFTKLRNLSTNRLNTHLSVLLCRNNKFHIVIYPKVHFCNDMHFGILPPIKLKIKKSKWKITLLAIRETFIRNILIGNICFFNHIVLIRNSSNFLFKSTFLKFEARYFMVHNCTESDFAKYV